jgi:hypothetical protein
MMRAREWGEHHPCLFHGTERFFRAGYNANLLSSWIPALDGVEVKLNWKTQLRALNIPWYRKNDGGRGAVKKAQIMPDQRTRSTTGRSKKLHRPSGAG